ncbi:MAG: hypothetical protein B7Z31_03065 [Rhodobacterales bacterium 12-65-15]|nr:MAG: hypothetical protein B7Z31_03065 [Rhodobacterales bacterium 12-65-15]
MTTAISLSLRSWKTMLPSMPQLSRLKSAGLLVALILAFGPVSPALANATDAVIDDSSSSAPTKSATATAKEVLAILNAARKKAGCGPLKLNNKLMNAAQTHATNMAKKDFFGHSNKDGSKFSSRVKRQGYKYKMVAENIAAGQSSATQVAYDWLGSPGHRKNILNCKFKDTGIAVGYQADDKPIMGNSKPFYYYWVQDFAAP